jgi:hypothetical protein
MTRLTFAAAILALSAAVAVACDKPRPADEKPRYEPTSNYTKQELRGFTIYMNDCLLKEDKELGDRVIELLSAKLLDIERAVPAAAVEKLRQVPIWLELKDRGFPCACYHPSKAWLTEHGYNPEKAGAVEIANAATFLKWTHEQPAMVLHELAHGYHDRFLGGYGNPKVAAAYRRAMDAEDYQSVLHWDGRKVRAYAANNPQEYFAELTEAWYGANDFYPFVRAEVLEHDPQGAEMLREMWGEKEAQAE